MNVRITALAIAVAASTLGTAAAQNVAISIYVLDPDGNHVYMDRMDGQGYLNIITAEMKARTALAQRAPSKVVMNQVRRDQNSELQRTQLGLFANSGGLPVVINHQMIGVIGVGGSAARVPVWSDEICGHKAMEEVLGAANVAPLIEDLPNPQNAPRANATPVPRFVTANAPKSNLSNPEWVVGGKGAANVFDGNQISLATAKKIAKVCRDFAAAKRGTGAALGRGAFCGFGRSSMSGATLAAPSTSSIALWPQISSLHTGTRGADPPTPMTPIIW